MAIVLRQIFTAFPLIAILTCKSKSLCFGPIIASHFRHILWATFLTISLFSFLTCKIKLIIHTSEGCCGCWGSTCNTLTVPHVIISLVLVSASYRHAYSWHDDFKAESSFQEPLGQIDSMLVAFLQQNSVGSSLWKFFLVRKGRHIHANWFRFTGAEWSRN
jgi:hypothetical protein